MDRKERRAVEASAGLFPMGVGLVILLLNIASSTEDVAVSLLGLGFCVIGGSIYR
jgi:hypothetical protein